MTSSGKLYSITCYYSRAKKEKRTILYFVTAFESSILIDHPLQAAVAAVQLSMMVSKAPHNVHFIVHEPYVPRYTSG